jgi:hypothetical protein
MNLDNFCCVPLFLPNFGSEVFIFAGQTICSFFSLGMQNHEKSCTESLGEEG